MPEKKSEEVESDVVLEQKNGQITTRKSKRFKVGQLVEFKDFDKKWYPAVVKKIKWNEYQIRTFCASLFFSGKIHLADRIRHPNTELGQRQIEELRKELSKLPHDFT